MKPVLNIPGARLTVYKDKREAIVTSVSTCGLQRQSHKANKVQMKYSKAESSYWNTITHNKTAQSRTFQ